MCGIIGCINQPISEDILLSINHRGPDHHSIYSSDCGQYKISLGHTRLSIVDLSENGNQPMISDDGNYALVFNGEIYNHMDVRKTLSHRAYKGHADSETLLYFLIEKGIDKIAELNGIYAFVFYDRKTAKMICARDPFGVKPLYYTSTHQTFAAASEIRAIRTYIDKEIDMTSLRLLLQLRYTPSPYTLYKDVKKLRPGHYLSIDMTGDELKIETRPIRINFFTTSGTKPKPFTGDFNLAVKEYGERLKAAVERQLMGDVDMGLLLSGGIDSALIAGLMKQVSSQKNIQTFTVGFDSHYNVNEIEYAAETAKYFGLPHHSVRIDATDFYDTLTKCSKIVEEPIATTSVIPMYYLSDLASRYVKVVLTGQGADEPLGGYQKYQGELLRQQYPNIMFSLLHHLVKLTPTKKETILRAANSLYIKDDIKRFVKIATLFSEDEIKELTGGFDVNTAYDVTAYTYNLINLPNDTAVEKLMAVDTYMNLSDDLLMYTDKVTMHYSLECRVPMLDFGLVSFIQSLPAEFKLKRGSGKIVHRAFAHEFLPESIINRPKLGFKSPTEEWFRRDAHLIRERLHQGNLGSLLNMKAIDDIIDKHSKGYNYEKQIFLLLSIQDWIDNM